MKLKKILFSLFLFHCVFNGYAQLRYPIVGRYNGKAGQAMAIWGENAYIFNDGGHCRVYNLVSEKLSSEYDISSAYVDNHVNACCFGNEYARGNDIPYIYITECRNDCRCFVEEIKPDTTILKQSIRAVINGSPLRVIDWVVDNTSNRLYAITRTDKTLKTEGYSKNTVIVFRLPAIEEGKEVILGSTDIEYKYVLNFPNILQDAKIKEGKLYILTGLHQSRADHVDGGRAIIVVDLKTRKIQKLIDLTYVTVNEPEGIDFYNNKILVFCGQEGGIYEVKIAE